MTKIKELLKAQLEELAKRETWSEQDDFNPYEMSGGNFDDAYWAGVDDGAAKLAQNLLNEFF